MNVSARLKQSKTKSNKRQFEKGVKLGREWAEQSADADQLELLARSELPEVTIEEVADFVESDVETMVGQIDLLASFSPHFSEGFVTGALVVFAEHFEIRQPTGVTLNDARTYCPPATLAGDRD